MAKFQVFKGWFSVIIVLRSSSNSSNSHFLLYMKVFLKLKITNGPIGYGIDEMTVEECIVQRFKSNGG